MTRAAVRLTKDNVLVSGSIYELDLDAVENVLVAYELKLLSQSPRRP